MDPPISSSTFRGFTMFPLPFFSVGNQDVDGEVRCIVMARGLWDCQQCSGTHGDCVIGRRTISDMHDVLVTMHPVWETQI